MQINKSRKIFRKESFWTYILQNKLGGNLWAYPAVIGTASYGFDANYNSASVSGGTWSVSFKNGGLPQSF